MVTVFKGRDPELYLTMDTDPQSSLRKVGIFSCKGLP